MKGSHILLQDAHDQILYTQFNIGGTRYTRTYRFGSENVTDLREYRRRAVGLVAIVSRSDVGSQVWPDALSYGTPVDTLPKNG